MAHGAVHIYRALGLLDAVLTGPHFREQGGEDHVGSVALWTSGLALLSMTLRLLLLSLAFPEKSCSLAISLWTNVSAQRFSHAIVRCATSCMCNTHTLKVQTPLHASQWFSHSQQGYNLSTEIFRHFPGRN